MASLLKSRKFWITVVDLVVSMVTYFVGRYASPQAGTDILWAIGACQPVILMLIYSIAVEDAASLSNPALVAPPEPVTPAASMIPPIPAISPEQVAALQTALTDLSAKVAALIPPGEQREQAQG